MFQWFKGALASRFATQRKMLAPLLLAAAAVYAATFALGCDDEKTTSPDPAKVTTNTEPAAKKGEMTSNAADAAPNSQAQRTLGTKGGRSAGLYTLTWSPPPGSGDPAFDRQPEAGGPPYVWHDVAAGEVIGVDFNLPGLAPGRTSMTVVDTLEIETGGRAGAVSFATRLGTGRSGEDLAAPAASPAQAAAPSPAGDQATYDLWRVGRWVDAGNERLTAERCRIWMDFLQSDSAFWALRAPVSPTLAITQAYPLPAVFGEPNTNRFSLYEWGVGTPILTASLELRPERLTFLENELPASAGERWLAFGLTEDPVVCPDGLDLAPDSWSWGATTLLDLSHQPDNCRGCIMPTYYCYEGQEVPAPFAVPAALARLPWSSAESTSYSGWGITCLGPHPLQLFDIWPSWNLSGASLLSVEASHPITLHHYLENWSGPPVSVNLSFSSTLAVDWAMYGSAGGSGPIEPITPPLTADGILDIFLVSEPVPPSTPAGSYVVTFNASRVGAPEDRRQVADIIWVGDWVAPPRPPSGGGDYRAFLPLVRR